MTKKKNSSTKNAKHCRTCRCGIKLTRHVCWKCKTRKLEKFMTLRGGEIRGWGNGGHWYCTDEKNCKENENYR